MRERRDRENESHGNSPKLPRQGKWLKRLGEHRRGRGQEGDEREIGELSRMATWKPENGGFIGL